MRIYDIIRKKKERLELSAEEINFFVKGFSDGIIPDYQVSALLMAICINGMTKQETADMTMAMAKSGDMIDLSDIEGKKVDKHSTGGVGDKTTLIISPIVASCGIPIAKMSGRGLGHTGGTVDKLESIKNLRTSFSVPEFIENVKKCGICLAGQSGNLVPADKKLYALRDVTAAVDSLPLIASSIMSKKIAAGSDCVLLDVKTGSGAFMKTFDGAVSLAQAMVEIGELSNRKTVALITDMDRPLGYAVGNSLEVIEAVDTLKGKGPEDLEKICIELAANMLVLGEYGDIEKSRIAAVNAIKSGRAFEVFCKMVENQSGDVQCLTNPRLFEKPGFVRELKAVTEGYIGEMDVQGIGDASVLLGAGRSTYEENIDYSAGLLVHKKTGDKISRGDVLVSFMANSEDRLNAGMKRYLDSLRFSDVKPKDIPYIYAKVTPHGIEKSIQ